MSSIESPLVFISYTVKDQERVMPFCDYLEHSGINVWMDCKRLKGGQQWDFEIQKAHRRAVIVIIFLSKNFIEKRGYNQREVKMSLKNLEEKFDDDIYIIPVLLDDIEQEQIERPVALQHIQMINGYLPEGKEQILDSIKTQFEKMKIELKHIQEETKIFWTVKPIVKSWDGFPGYKVNFDFIEFQSHYYSNISYISDIINAVLKEKFLETTSGNIEQDTNRFDVGSEIEYRTNTYNARFNNVCFKGHIISIVYNFDVYTAGNAHGQYCSRCYNFILNPLMRINNISWLLKDEAGIFDSLQKIIRDKLITMLQVDIEKDQRGYDWLISGTNSFDDLSNFAFIDECIEFFFDNYQVAGFAKAVSSILVSYDEIYHLLSQQAKEQLGLDRKLD